jgi:hypothetical protein
MLSPTHKIFPQFTVEIATERELEVNRGSGRCARGASGSQVWPAPVVFSRSRVPVRGELRFGDSNRRGVQGGQLAGMARRAHARRFIVVMTKNDSLGAGQAHDEQHNEVQHRASVASGPHTLRLHRNRGPPQRNNRRAEPAVRRMTSQSNTRWGRRWASHSPASEPPTTAGTRARSKSSELRPIIPCQA